MPLNVTSDRASLPYTACYCEENIWKLCELVRDQESHQLNSLYAVFISNDKEMTPIWGQKAGEERKEYLVVWDYHVIAIHREDTQSSMVYDYDTVLPFPVDFSRYLANNLRYDQVSAEFGYQFRVIPAAEYLVTFASDRSRMRTPDGRYIKPPPTYVCIRTPAETNNLNRFLSMDPTFPVGQVMDTQEFKQMFG